MKLPLDRNRDLTNIYRVEELPASATITHTPADLFHRLLPEEHFKRVFSQIQTKEVKDLESAEAQYNELREAVQKDPAAVNALKLPETEKAKFLRTAASGGLHKVTYEVEGSEDFNAIKKALENLPSGAILRAVEADEKGRKITVYSSSFGAWEVGDNLFVKNAEAASKAAGKVRMQFSLRDLREPAKLSSDLSRMDFPIYEDLSTLFSAGLIERLDKPTEQADKTWRIDPQYSLFPHHFKAELSEEELKALEVKEEAAKAVKKETSHQGKAQATKAEAAQAVEKNEKEIHTSYPSTPAPAPTAKEEKKEKAEAPAVEKPAAADPLKAIQETKEQAIEAFLSRQLKELEERQQREREELKIKVENAKRERDTAKTLYISALQKGNTLEEALHHLRAAKFDDVTIAAALEEVKAEMLAASTLEGVIAEKEAAIEKQRQQLEGLAKKLEESERVRKTNHERYLSEIEKRKQVEAMAEKLAAAGAKLKEKIGAQNVEIQDLRQELNEERKRAEALEAEIERQEARHAEDMAAAEKREERLLGALEATREEIKGFRAVLEKMQAENAELRAKIEELAEAKAEAEALKEAMAAAKAENAQLREVEERQEKEVGTSIEELQKLAKEVLHNEGKHESAADNEAAEAEEER